MSTTQFLLSMLFRSVGLGILGLTVLFCARRFSAANLHKVALGLVVALATLPGWNQVLPGHRVSVKDAPAVVVYLTAPKNAPARIAVPPMKPEAHSAASAWSLEDLIPLVWKIGTGLLILRYLIGMLLLVLRVRRSRRAPIDFLGAPILEMDGASVPMTVWAGRSYILLPSSWREWPGDRVARVVTHENAHILRRDWLSQSVMHLCCALLWPNPMVWIAARRARYFAECAADEHVLSEGAPRDRYAADLLDFARHASPRTPALAVPMAAKADVARRIEMILCPRSTVGGFGRVGVLTLVSGLALAAVPLASWALQKIPASDAIKKSDAKQVFYAAQVFERKAGGGAIFAHHISVGSTDCRECHRGVTGGTFAAGRAGTTTMIVSSKVADRIVHDATSLGASLAASPKLLTLDGQKASIELVENQTKRTLALTPMVTDSGAIVTNVSVVITDGGQILHQLDAVAATHGKEVIVLFGRRKDGTVDTIVEIRAGINPAKGP